MVTSVVDAVEEWIADNRVRKRRGFSNATERAYRTDIAMFAKTLADRKGADPADIDPHDPWGPQNGQLSRIKLTDFDDRNMGDVFGALIDAGAAPASRGRMLSALRGFCRWCVSNDLIDVDPTEAYETPQAADKLPVAFSEHQLRAIFTAAANPDKRLRAHWPRRDVALVGVLAGCGLRSAELIGLTVGRIDRQGPYRLRVTGKGSKDRVVPLSEEVLEAVDLYLDERHDRELGGGDIGDLVFVRNNGAALNNQALQTLVVNWLAAAGIPAPTGEKAHAFRHTYAVSQLDYGTNPAELQALLGHKNLATTSQYLRVAAEGLHHTARATPVNAILSEFVG